MRVVDIFLIPKVSETIERLLSPLEILATLGSPKIVPSFANLQPCLFNRLPHCSLGQNTLTSSSRHIHCCFAWFKHLNYCPNSEDVRCVCVYFNYLYFNQGFYFPGINVLQLQVYCIFLIFPCEIEFFFKTFLPIFTKDEDNSGVTCLNPIQ